MAQTAAHLVDHVIPNVPVRQWVLSLPIPLRVLFAAHPHLLSPVLQVIQRAISTFLIRRAGFKRRNAQTGVITLIQRFGSAATLNIHLHCLVLDGVYHIQGGVPAFHGVLEPNAKLRSEIIPGNKKNKSNVSDTNDDVPPSPASVRISWARLLKGVFGIDIERCPHCVGGCINPRKSGAVLSFRRKETQRALLCPLCCIVMKYTDPSERRISFVDVLGF